MTGWSGGPTRSDPSASSSPASSPTVPPRGTDGGRRAPAPAGGSRRAISSAASSLASPPWPATSSPRRAPSSIWRRRTGTRRPAPPASSPARSRRSSPGRMTRRPPAPRIPPSSTPTTVRWRRRCDARASALTLEELLEPAQIRPVGAPDRAGHERRRDLREAGGLAAVPQPHPRGAHARVLPGVRRLHRERPFRGAHDEPRPGHVLAHLVGVGDPPSEEAGDEGEPRADRERRRRLPAGGGGVPGPGRSRVLVRPLGGDLVTRARDHDLGLDVDGHRLDRGSLAHPLPTSR